MSPASRIIYIPGILTSPKLLNHQWRQACTEMFPGRSVIVIEATYIYTQHQILQSIKQEVLGLLSDGVPTILVGHSFGGIIAIACSQEALKQGMGSVSKIITLAAPHSMDKAPGMLQAKEVLGYCHAHIPDTPLYTFGARADHIVPCKYTNYLDSRHIDLHCTHSGFWLNPRQWRYRHVWNALRD